MIAPNSITRCFLLKKSAASIQSPSVVCNRNVGAWEFGSMIVLKSLKKPPCSRVDLPPGCRNYADLSLHVDRSRWKTRIVCSWFHVGFLLPCNP